MTARSTWKQIVLRAPAVLLMAVPIGLYAMAPERGLGRPALAFVAVMCICAGLTLFTRGLGIRMGALLGVGIGAIAGLVLVSISRAGTGAMLTFGSVSMTVMGVLGMLAGAWPVGPRPAPVLRSDANGNGHGPALPGPGARATNSRRPAEEILAAITSDFCRWTEGGSGVAPWIGRNGWAALDQFVRQTLREHLGASGVRVFQVSAAPHTLEPLSGARPPADIEMSARDGLINYIVTCGEPYVANAEDQGLLMPELARAEGERAGGGNLQPPWAWLLPLRAGRSTRGLVVIEQISDARCMRRSLALAVREHLQLFWLCVSQTQALGEWARTDRGTGILNRPEFVQELRETARAAAREGEPLMILSLALEGLRQLDDTGQFARKDTLLMQFGQVLKTRMRADDVLARFSDDRFVVVLRRLDSGLGTLIAEKLMETLREQVLDPFVANRISPEEAGAASTLRLRGGLAGSGFPIGGGGSFLNLERVAPAANREAAGAADGLSLLERSLGLLDYARSQRIDIATDVMEGLPANLLRNTRPEPATSDTGSSAAIEVVIEAGPPAEITAAAAPAAPVANGAQS